MSVVNFPPSMNLADIKQSALQECDGQFLRYRSDNSSYVNGDTIRLEIPCGRKGQWLHPQDSFLEFKMTSGTSTFTSGAIFLDGNCLTYFKQARIYHGSNLLCSINDFNRIAHSMYDLQVNTAERQCQTINLGVGGVQTATSESYDLWSLGAGYGHLIDNASTYAYSHPLMLPLLGSLTEKAVPLGWMTSSLYLELVIEDAQKCVTTRYGDSITGSAGTCTALSVAQMTFKDIYYNAKVSQVAPMYDNLLLNAFQGKRVLIPSVDFKSELKSISSSSSSFSDKFSFNLSSVKFIWFWLTNTSTANGVISGYNLAAPITQRMAGNLNSYNLSLNGVNFPSIPISCSTTGNTIKVSGSVANHIFGSACYQQLLRTMNQNTDFSSGGVLSKNTFCHSLTTQASDILDKKSFIGAIDLDRFDGNNSRYMQGANLQNQNIQLVATWDTALAENCNLYAFAQCDVAFELRDGLLYVNA